MIVEEVGKEQIEPIMIGSVGINWAEILILINVSNSITNHASCLKLIIK